MNEAFRSMRLMIVLLLSLVALWLALPWITSLVAERWLERLGYDDVALTLGRPGLRSMAVPSMVLTRRLTGEIVTISLNNAQADYTLLGLLSGRIDLLTLRKLSVEISTPPAGPRDPERHPDEASPDAPDSLLNVLTAGDVVRQLPFFPCDEVRIEEVKVFREQATGPLRTVVMTGTIKREREALVAELLLQGVDTIPYELRVISESTAGLSLQLRAAQPEAKPFVLWRSQSVPNQAKVHLEGVLEINVHELAPFLALAVPIGPEWQRVGGNVTIHWAGSAASGVPVAALWKDPSTEVHATVQVEAALPQLKGYGKDVAVKTTGTLSGNIRLLRWTLAAGTSVTATVSGMAVKGIIPLGGLFRYGPQPIRFESSQDSTGELFWTESPPRFTGSGPVLVSYGSQKGPVYAECVVTHIVGHGRSLDHAAANVLVRGTVPSAMIDRLNVKQAAVELRGVMTWTAPALRGTLNPSSSATFAEFKQEPVAISGGTLHLEEPLQVDIDIRTGRWALGPGSLKWRSPLIQVAGASIAMQRAVITLERLEGSARAYHAQANARLEGFAVAQSGVRSQPVDVSVRAQADSGMLKAEIQAESPDRAVKMTAQVEHDLTAGRGTVHGLFGPVRFDRATVRLGQLLSPWTYPLDITKGQVAGTFDLRWTNDGQRPRVQGGSAEIAADDLAGRYRDVLLRGVTTKMKVTMEGFERIVSSKPAEVTIASIDTGVEATDVKMTVEGEWDFREKLPLIEVRNIRAALLGGTMTSQGTRADLGYPPYAFTVLFSQLDLHKVLNLEQQKNLQGTGILDGSIPVTVTARGFTVQDGSFEARPPGGVIRYVASPEGTQAVTQASENMHVVLGALNNFHYNVLQGRAHYTEDGTLQLMARLEGKNPDRSNSPPIHFNLTVQENIPALLKSLRLVDGLEDSVRNTFVRP